MPRESRRDPPRLSERNYELLKGIVGSVSARQLSKKFNSIRDIAISARNGILETEISSRSAAEKLKTVFQLFETFEQEQVPDKPLVCCPQDVWTLLGNRYRLLELEQVTLLLLSSKNHLEREISFPPSSIDRAPALRPRDILRPALTYNAAAIALVHNHPSGDPTPSENDICFTQTLSKVAGQLGIPLRDHVILGHPTTSRPRPYCSLRELGYL